jgi:hypothetical protein
MLLDLFYLRRLRRVHVRRIGWRHLLSESNNAKRHLRRKVRQQLRLLRKNQPQRIRTTT